MLESLFSGFFLSLAMIIAIGAQNAFVLKKGISNDNLFLVCLICFLCDFILMSLGVFGVGGFISNNTIFKITLAVTGSIFLLFYGISSLKESFVENKFILDKNLAKSTKSKAIITTLAITLLNPHVYLDTVVVVGGVAGTLVNSLKIYFISGALIASFIWFFGLGYGARRLAPIFEKPSTWKFLNLAISIFMFLISFKLFYFAYQNAFN